MIYMYMYTQVPEMYFLEIHVLVLTFDISLNRFSFKNSLLSESVALISVDMEESRANTTLTYVTIQMYVCITHNTQKGYPIRMYSRYC